MFEHSDFSSKGTMTDIHNVPLLYLILDRHFFNPFGRVGLIITGIETIARFDSILKDFPLESKIIIISNKITNITHRRRNIRAFIGTF